MNHRAVFIAAVLAVSFSSAGAEDAHEDHLPGDAVVDDAGNADGNHDRAAKPAADRDTGRDTNDGTMPGMNHGDLSGADQGKNHEMDHGVDAPENTESVGGMNQGASRGVAASPDARDPHAYSEGYDFRPLPRLHTGDQHKFGAFLTDRFELARTGEERFMSYDVFAWYGRDFDRLWFKSEGEVDAGRLQQARSELLWGHALTAFWDGQIGARYDNDSGAGPDRAWLALGFQGLAPYWFEVETTAYVGDAGGTALRVKAEYELLFTQKLILQPRIEAEARGRRDAKSGLGSGLSGLTAGVRLRYEIRREFAPYIGVEWAGVYGGTADYARAAGRRVDEGRLVAGVRFWF